MGSAPVQMPSEHPAQAPSIAAPTTRAPERSRNLWRLRPYLKPHRWRLAVMFSTAMLGVAVSLAVPLVTKAIIDGPVIRRELSMLVPLALLALGLSISEVILVWMRRWAQSRTVSDLEATLRQDLYVRLQSLPMEFHTRWQSGQLLSRVTTDLSTIRRFMGFGLLFLVMNILQVVVVTIVLLNMYWPLGLVVAVVAIPVIVVSNRFERKYLLVSRRVQDEQGDLATLAEEGAVGIRVIKSFGRGRFMSEQYDAAAGRLYETSMEKVRLS